jgi:predicted DNA binding CopG/RHH family protein
LGQDFGEKERLNMKNKTKYTKAPPGIAKAISESKVIKDFLPAPDRLIFKEESIKVTLSLGKDSVQFFKKKAKESHVPYQNMIKRVVDMYAKHYMESGTRS